MNKNRKITIGIIILVVATAALSFMITTAVFMWNGFFKPRYEIAFDPQKVSIENINKFEQVRSILKSNFYMDVDENVLLEGAISGMADSLNDPYTVYFNKEQMKNFVERSGGSYVGIGVLVTMDSNGLLTVIEAFEDSPASKVGMKQGDKIIGVDGKDVSGIKDEDMIISMIKGPENTKVKVTVYRPSESRSIDFEITRKKIKIANIKSEILPNGIGYIRIIMFDNEIASYFMDHLQKLMNQGIRALVIDLRDNPGGSYDQVVKIADRILPKGLIVYTEDKHKKRSEEYSDERELDIPIAVLINGNSASASEILAGAIKDYNKGTLVGTKTFGKGLVQVLVPLNDGSGLKVTVARYFTPLGVCIQGEGIKPHTEVQLPAEYSNMPISQIPRGDDVQLQTAVEILRAKLR